MKFRELNNLGVAKNEELIMDKWLKEDIYQKTLDIRKDADNYVFYDGPATANGHPGLHHMVAKFLKDSFCKYQTMKGFKVIRKIGWDTHGLPVELEVEKELGFKSKLDIEKYGIENFNCECKNSVFKYQELFEKLTNRMGQFVDLKNPYITYENDYIETEWWILKKFFDEGLFYKGHKVIPYCPRCGTGLATHEVAQGYEEITTDTVTVPFKLKDRDVYFLVWTTTPWTLISNVAVAINPNEEYVEAESKGHTFIVAKKLLNQVLGNEAKVIKTYIGKDLEYVEYEQVLPFLEVAKKAFYVTLADYVTMEDGTGIVHIAPAFGEEDSQVAKKYNLPYLNPVDQEGKYSEGPWKDLFVFDADLEIIKYLKENNKLFNKQKVNHNYPHCWRCTTPLIYTTIPSYYLEITKIKDKIVEENKKINWYPSYVGEKRFGNWLENLNDWAISRNRYWGTPLPYYTCECGYDHMIGSIQELKSMATTEVKDDLDLHRPYIDEIKLECPKCSKEMSRVIDVLDCWFDSGAMPFSQYHYPFETKMFEDQFPADFICEGIDQTRGWFYTLLVISTFVTGKSPYKNVLVNDLLLDGEGKKMSKSRGNVIEPFTAMDEYGADVVRFYLPYVSPVWVPIKFDMSGLKEVHSKFFNPLRNTYNFFALYANTDEINIKDCKIDYFELEEIDKWIISKYNSLVKNVTKYYDEFDLNKVVKALTNFVSEDLSNWYIRRNRDRFWSSELNSSKKGVYYTTHQVLVGITKLLAPISPFLSEEMYINLTDEYSVHTADFPKYDQDLIDPSLEEKMDLVRTLISLGRMVREENKVKVKQPLSEILLPINTKKLIGDLTNLIKEELNVKNIIFIEELDKYIDYEIKPNYRLVGKQLGSQINDFKELLLNLEEYEKNDLDNGLSIDKRFNDDVLTITPDMIEVAINPKEGFNIGREGANFVILNTNLTNELIEEGIAREIVSKIQNIRKEKDFFVADRIIIEYNSNELIETAIDNFKDYIMSETLAVEMNKVFDKLEEHKINDEIVYIRIKKA